jgi:hypothetical protein
MRIPRGNALSNAQSLAELAKTTFVERPPALCVVMSVRASAFEANHRRRFTFQSVGDIIHHPEARLAFATENLTRVLELLPCLRWLANDGQASPIWLKEELPTTDPESSHPFAAF